MPELSVTDEQLRRLRSVCSDLEAAYVGPYGRVQPEDALEYLLDTYTPPEEGDAAAMGAEPGAAQADAGSEPGAGAAGDDDGDGGGDAEEVDDDLTAIEGVGEVTAAALAEAGFDSLSAIEAADPAALTEAEGVGEKQAVDIVAAVAEMDHGGSDAASGGDADGGGGGGSGSAGPGAGDPTTNSPADTLQQAMSLLDAHDDRWRESSGDEPYEVDLPDGSTEAVRTKDDVKRLLFKHWR